MDTEDLDLIKSESFKNWKKSFPETVSDEILVMRWKHNLKEMEEYNKRITKEEKKKIIQDWQNLFPNFIKRQKTSADNYVLFSKLVGPISVTLSLSFCSGQRYYRALAMLGNLTHENGGVCNLTGDHDIYAGKHEVIIKKKGVEYTNY
ncbi:MAG: hypothetical protein LBD81_00125, partial [Holosporaceae bacterium]|nr:hypothetical protein [Holosporaceae bacterium]